MGSRDSGCEGIDDAETIIVLPGVQVFGVDGVAGEGSGGGEDGGVPVGDLEALGDGEGGVEKIRRHGLHREAFEATKELHGVLMGYTFLTTLSC